MANAALNRAVVKLGGQIIDLCGRRDGGREWKVSGKHQVLSQFRGEIFSFIGPTVAYFLF